MTADFVRVDMDDDGTAEISGWIHTGGESGREAVFFSRTADVDDTAAAMRRLLAAGWMPGQPDDDPRVPGRTGTTYTRCGAA